MESDSDDSGIFHRPPNAKQTVLVGGDSSEEDIKDRYSVPSADALLLAVTTSNVEGLVKLLAAKADLKWKVDRCNSVALHHAVLAGSAKCVEILLLQKVRVLDDVCFMASAPYMDSPHTTRPTQMQLTQILSRL